MLGGLAVLPKTGQKKRAAWWRITRINVIKNSILCSILSIVLHQWNFKIYGKGGIEKLLFMVNGSRY